jgi:protein TonB
MYPRDSLLRGEQGTVAILIEVEDSGRISSVTVKESSGFPALDRAATMHAQHAWFFPPGKGQRMFECPIIFRLQ